VQKPVPYMVFSCLTPVRFARYINCNLCLKDSSQESAFVKDEVEASEW